MIQPCRQPQKPGLIMGETFGMAPLTAPLYSGELPKAEGFFRMKFHTRAPRLL